MLYSVAYFNVDVVLVADMFVLYPGRQIQPLFPGGETSRVTCLMLPQCGLLNHGLDINPI